MKNKIIIITVQAPGMTPFMVTAVLICHITLIRYCCAERQTVILQPPPEKFISICQALTR